MRFTLYPIQWLADEVDGHPFDKRQLPFDIFQGVRIEDVSQRFLKGTFDLFKARLGEEIIQKLERVRYALVHRYKPETTFVNGEFFGEVEQAQASENLIRRVAACLRLIRPMRQSALFMAGSIRDDGTFDVPRFDSPPLHLIEVPDVQTLFMLRDCDAADLKTYTPEFIRAMGGQFWKFRMAIQFHELGHFQALDWKARYIMWCSAIESIYTSHAWEHKGSVVAKARIKWFLGENTSIYAPGDISDLLTDPHITVGQILDDLYEMRNFLAHGDRLDDRFFTDYPRSGFQGQVQRWEVLTEAASFIIRTSLLKILRDGLLHHFADAGPAEAFFATQGLTRKMLTTKRP
jgi:hypothetical protein